MTVLFTTLNKMLELFSVIFIGYIFRKKNILPKNAGEVLSKLENYFLMPSLIINTFITKCTLENLVAQRNLIICEIIIIVITVLISFVCGKFLAVNPDNEKIVRYALVVPNFAFMGNAVVESVFGGEMLYKYMIFTIPLNIFTYTIGVMWLMPRQQEGKKGNFLNPIVVSLAIGIVIGISGIRIPSFIMNTVAEAGKCMAVIAMTLTGFIIGNYEIKKMLTDIDNYVLALLRLIILPVAASWILSLMGVEPQTRMLAVCTLAMPFGLNTIIISAAYGGDTKKGAAMALISHALAVITIPVVLAVAGIG